MEGGSFSVTAKKLGIGQPAVSKPASLRSSSSEERSSARGSSCARRAEADADPRERTASMTSLRFELLNTFERACARSVRETFRQETNRHVAYRPCPLLSVKPPLQSVHPIVQDYVREFPEVKVDLRFTRTHESSLVEKGIEAWRCALAISVEFTGWHRRIGTVRVAILWRRRPIFARDAPPPGRRMISSSINAHRALAAPRAGQQVDIRGGHGRHVVTIAGSVIVDARRDAMQEAVQPASWACCDHALRGTPPARSGAAG